MKCINPITIYVNKLPYVVSCRRCIACKINKTTEWQLRIMAELSENDKAIFLTLTYNDDNLPEDLSLHKEDFQVFIKALRQRYPERKLTYFACGEYGSINKRPHFHAIIFGMSNTLEERIDMFESWKKCDSFLFFGKNWNKTVGTVTPDSAAYVAGYCQKKFFGDYAKIEYRDKQPPFQLQSKFLGEKYFKKNISLYKESGYIMFNGRRMPIPETWKRKYNIKLTSNQAKIELKVWQEFISYVNEHKDCMYKYFKGRSISDLKFDALAAGYSTFHPSNLCKYPGQEQAYRKYVIAKNNLKEKRVL